MAERFVRPFTPGMPIGNVDGSAGTLSLFAQPADIADSRVYAVSCSHVLANFGFGITDPSALRIVQPLEPVASLEERTVGRLTSIFSQLVSDGENTEDFAAAELTGSGDAWLPEVPDIGTPSEWQADFAEGSAVSWYGAISRRQDGQVIKRLQNAVFLEVPGFQARRFRFSGLVSFAPKPAPGDSGSPVFLKDTRSVIGIAVGKHPTKDLGYFYPIVPIFNKYQLRLAIK